MSNSPLESLKLNSIARIILLCFQDAGYEDRYIREKMRRIEKMNQWQTIEWASHQLDTGNKTRFAEIVGVSLEDLRVTFAVIGKIDDIYFNEH